METIILWLILIPAAFPNVPAPDAPELMALCKRTNPVATLQSVTTMQSSPRGVTIVEAVMCSIEKQKTDPTPQKSKAPVRSETYDARSQENALSGAYLLTEIKTNGQKHTNIADVGGNRQRNGIR